MAFCCFFKYILLLHLYKSKRCDIHCYINLTTKYYSTPDVTDMIKINSMLFSKIFWFLNVILWLISKEVSERLHLCSIYLFSLFLNYELLRSKSDNYAQCRTPKNIQIYWTIQVSICTIYATTNISIGNLKGNPVDSIIH